MLPIVEPLVVVFRTQSDVEASIVRGLLDTHGIRSIQSSDVPHSVFPLSINGLGEVRISVRADEADEALEVIASHRRPDTEHQVVRLQEEFDRLEQTIGYRFKDRGLLEHALTHRSRAHEDVTGGVFDNESLEFLGDAVLGFLIADLLFREFPWYSEGQKSKMKAALVSTTALAGLGLRIGLGEHLLLGRGEERSGGRTKRSLIADTCEALIAAMYLDGGLDVVREFVWREFKPEIEELRGSGQLTRIAADHKSALQEALQSRGKGLPEYRITGERGPDHRKLFEVEVQVEGMLLGKAEGRSKKEAEQLAAKEALSRLER